MYLYSSLSAQELENVGTISIDGRAVTVETAIEKRNHNQFTKPITQYCT